MLTRSTPEVTIATVLLEVDSVPEVALARDIFGGTYLCVLTGISSERQRFLAVQISDSRLADLRRGVVDLASVLREPESQSVYFSGEINADTRVDRGKPIMRLTALDEIEERWIPDRGFYLSAFEDQVSSDQLVSDAMRKDAPVIACRLSPPESQGSEPKILADRLVDCVRDFQELVRLATRKVLPKKGSSRRSQLGSDPFALKVYAFSGGSFTIHFEATERADLFGSSYVGAGMERIDELMKLAQLPPDEVLPGLIKHKGVELAAYRALLKFVDDSDSPLEYRWAQPAMSVPSGARITPPAARAIGAILDSKSALSREPVEFTGRFVSVNTDRQPFTWSARDADDKRRHGMLHEESPAILNGAIIRDVTYTFHCEKRLEQDAVGRRLRPALYLQSVYQQ